ncbi:hypothetical protein [Novosphingobium resinovorum]|nr:hypothetical protein [Novosphingobium resinovorum]
MAGSAHMGNGAALGRIGGRALAWFSVTSLLSLAIDHFMDMGRPATNVLGDTIATCVVSHWEDRRRMREEVLSAHA